MGGGGGERGGGGGGGGDLNDSSTKLQLIDTMLSSSPPLPAPPAMQQAQIQAQERELERQMHALRLQQQQQASAAASSTASAAAAVSHASMPAPRAHRPTISSGVKPLVIKNSAVAPVAAAPASSALAAQLKPRLAAAAAQAQSAAPGPPISSAAASAAAASSDLFAKVEVQPRARLPAGGSSLAGSFAPSSLSAALSDSGMLYRGGDRHAAIGRDHAHHKGAHNADSSSSAAGASAAGPGALTLTFYLHPFSDTLVRPTRILLALPSDGPLSNPTLDELMSSLLQKWSSGELRANFGLRAALDKEAAQPNRWEIRMVDEDSVDSDDEALDEEDVAAAAACTDADDDAAALSLREMLPGQECRMPEEDLPALDRAAHIKTLATSALVMMPAKGCKHEMPPPPPPPPPPPMETAAQPTAAAAASPAAPSTDPAAAAAAGSAAALAVAGSSTAASPVRPSASPRSAAAAGLPPQLGRYKTLQTGDPRGAPGGAAAAAARPAGGVPPKRAVSVFGGAGTASHNFLSGGGAPTSAAQQQRQHAMASDPSRASILLGPGGIAQQLGHAPAAAAPLEKFYLKIHIGDHESHIIGLYKTQLLSEVLPLLSQKKQTHLPMKSEAYRFLYLDPLLQGQNDGAIKDMARIRVGELASDELVLIPRLGGGGGGGSSALGAAANNHPSGDAADAPYWEHGAGVGPGRREGRSETFSGSYSTDPSDSSSGAAGGAFAGPSTATGARHHGSMLVVSDHSTPSFQFTLESASVYAEHKVVKTNQRGKRQLRILGIDRYKIYNKLKESEGGDPSAAGGGGGGGGGGGAGGGGGMFSFFRSRIGLADESGVSRAYRYINTIASVHVVHQRPTCFVVSFKETADRAAKISQTREYELESRVECAEVVAKLRFLMAHAKPSDSMPNGAAASMPRQSILGASIK